MKITSSFTTLLEQFHSNALQMEVLSCFIKSGKLVVVVGVEVYLDIPHVCFPHMWYYRTSIRDDGGTNVKTQVMKFV